MPAIAEATSESEEYHVCPSCIHRYPDLQGKKPGGSKQKNTIDGAEISGPFDLKHVCHINADCKYIKGIPLF
jgi:hypothetical protein